MEDLVKASIGAFIFYILIIIIIFLLTRAFWCWYWKINKRVQILGSIDQRLADIQRLLAQGNTVNAVMTDEISNIASGVNSNKVAQQTIDDDEDLPEL
ncbi:MULTISPECIES: hypothetical protein [Clostridium]|uniref:Uncharacterized protein n=1 Tax=Clostridium ragsdalei P11 TaxID=1353534 RepID=A0A1A6AVN1_9CLOT|nr:MULTISPECIES: hypothetical protein [Clostridium]OBR94146.1 hypothetical protein CLRAG_16860 [Clostridium ragsdalei P11]QXE20960.1 hypothetical protein B5S50_20065 [Clostridium sp. 001]